MSTRRDVPPPTHHNEEATSFGAWTLVWVIYGAKVVTIVLVVWAEHSYRSALFVTVTTWFWLGPLLALGAAPLMFRYRLRRVRARRATLIVSEWHIAPGTGRIPSDSTAPEGTREP
jgi:hypothetical protein